MLAGVLLAGCSSGDYVVGSAPAPAPRPREAAAAMPVAAGTTAQTTGQDGYPNINVDTAQRIGGPARTTAEQDRLEAELLALGARQRAGADSSAPASVIGELQDLGRRSKKEAEQAIESGAVPE